MITIRALSYPFRSHQTWMNFVQDDFFYYLKVAQNLVAGHGSTFNGLVATNGYHPLWFGLIALAVRLGVEGRGLLGVLGVLSFAATMAMYGLSLRLLRRAGTDRVLGALIAAYVAVYSMYLFELGMEVTLATPLMLGLLVAVESISGWREDPAPWPRWLGLGLLTSALVMSRLDTILFAGMLGVAVVLTPELRRHLGAVQVGSLGVGLLPVAVYFLSNQRYFGTWLPVSGMAKQLKVDRGFTSLAWRDLFHGSKGHDVHLAIIVLGLVTIGWWWPRMQPAMRAVVCVMLLFPFGYAAVLSWTSDWRLWLWYFYDFRPALCVACLALLRVPVLSAMGRKPVVQGVLALLVLAAMLSMRWKEQFPAIVVAAEEVRQFEESHPGRYAMGDRSGAVGLLLRGPVVQTEGLMMDRQFLEAIRRQTPLREVLRQYGVRYYVGTALTPYTGCFEAAEPAQGGPHTPKMRAEICEAPEARWRNDGVETMVFDLRGK